jgi:hypothetical protein
MVVAISKGTVRALVTISSASWISPESRTVFRILRLSSCRVVNPQ